MEKRSHYFFAVRIPEHTKLVMRDHMEKIKEMIPFSRWVHYQDLHITLAFLGGAPPDKLTEADKNVRNALSDETALKLNINKLGFFGSVTSPRVFWADTEESTHLQTIRKRYFPLVNRQGFNWKQDHSVPILLLRENGWGNILFKTICLNCGRNSSLCPFHLMLLMWCFIKHT